MIASIIAVFLGICTVVLYVWFFKSRSSRENYESQRNIPLLDFPHELKMNQSEENKNE